MLMEHDALCASGVTGAVQVLTMPAAGNDAALAPVTAVPVTFRSPSPVLVTVNDSGSVGPAGTARFGHASVAVDSVAMAGGTTASADRMSKNELHAFDTGSLPMQNRRFSMFHKVSCSPSPGGNGPPAATESLSETSTLPFSALRVMV